MVALRTRPRGRAIAPFGLCTLAFTLLPAPIGTQDLSALFSYRAEAAQQSGALASPFGTIHLPTYSFPRPVGTAIPRLAGYQLASLNSDVLDIGGGLVPEDRSMELPALARRALPKVNRRLKGDSLLPSVSRPAVDTAALSSSVEADAALAPAADPERAPESRSLLDDLNADAPPEDSIWPALEAAELSPSDNPTMDTARLYFGDDPVSPLSSAVDPPEVEPDTVSDIESEIVVPVPAPQPADAGETVAAEGEVTGGDKRPMSLAERLALGAKARAKAEKCLADAVYFEARGESVRGQIAVAQVVMNRVFSEFYPDNVCAVVYQNAHRRLACQFTFACDGIPEVVTEPGAWRRAKRIAKDTLDGMLWLDDIGKATHYHASWVRPWWIRTMRKLHRIGVHTFYRPRRWGDGSDEPVWGSAAATAEVVKKL